jgi:hypothetical protein
MTNWQPIETAPKDGTHILLLVENKAIEGWYGYSELSKVHKWKVVELPIHGCGCCSCENDNPTGWTPLPEPPK